MRTPLCCLPTRPQMDGGFRGGPRGHPIPITPAGSPTTRGTEEPPSPGILLSEHSSPAQSQRPVRLTYRPTVPLAPPQSLTLPRPSAVTGRLGHHTLGKWDPGRCPQPWEGPMRRAPPGAGACSATTWGTPGCPRTASTGRGRSGVPFHVGKVGGSWAGLGRF